MLRDLKMSWLRVVIVGLAILFVVAGVVAWRASRALRTASQEVQSEGKIGFTIQPLPVPVESGFELISTPAVFSKAAEFQNDLYIAGPSGLSQYSPRGTLLKRYAVGQELPSSELVGIAPAMLADAREQELVIATAKAGLLLFNGRGFRQVLPQPAAARTITSVLPLPSGHLLIGTRKLGVLVYDGKELAVLHPTLKSVYVTTLAGTESDLWVGTLN